MIETAVIMVWLGVDLGVLLRDLLVVALVFTGGLSSWLLVVEGVVHGQWRWWYKSGLGLALTSYTVLALVFGELLWHVPIVPPSRIAWEFTVGIILFCIALVQMIVSLRNGRNPLNGKH